MNLKELVRTQSNLVANRQDESASLCKQAYFLIAEAENQGFADKAPLKQAMRLFIQAARQKRRFVEPYIGLAYLSLLIDQREVARKYLTTALQVEPDNEDAQRLLQYLSEEPEAQDEEGFKLPDLGGLDPDKLYDQLEQALFSLVRELMKLPPPLATLDPEAIEGLKRQSDDFETQVRTFDKQIHSLEREFDTSELRRRMRPLESMLQRAQKALEASERMQQIQTQIQGLLNTVRAISGRLSQASAELLQRSEQELESVMDSCDWVADQLDEIENQGHDISVLAHSYHVLTAVIEQIRDTLDELTA